MAYVMRPNSGSLFKNDRQVNASQPDYTGQVLINGVEYWQSAWTKDANGKKFFSQSFTPKIKTNDDAPPPHNDSDAPPENDLPF